MKNEKYCLVCNKKIVGRTNKIYCSDKCRAINHYQDTKGQTSFRKNVNNANWKNRNILMEANPSGKTYVSQQYLKEKGFNFNFFTHCYRTKYNNVYWFCYDYGFRYYPGKNQYLLVKWQSYMNTVFPTD